MPFNLASGMRVLSSVLNNLLGIVVNDTQLTAGTTISTAYVSALTGGTLCGSAFTAPTSGVVLVLFYGRIRNSAANIGLISVRIGDTSTVDGGTEIIAASDNNSIQHTGTADEGASGHFIVSGLTAGTVYNAAVRHRCNGGTGTFTSRKVTVLPIANF